MNYDTYAGMSDLYRHGYLPPELTDELLTFRRAERQQARLWDLRAAKRRSRVFKASRGMGLRSISIEVTQAEYDALSSLRAAANDGEDFWRRALLTGAKFRANIGAGKIKPGRSRD